MEHDELVKEMERLNEMSAHMRINLAKRRRRFQIKNYIDWITREVARERYVPREIRETKLKFSPDVHLTEAVTKGDLTELKILLDEGVDPNATNYEGLTPLHQCCIEGYSEMAWILLEKGANVNARDMDEWTPLHAAATCGHKDIVELLVRMGADLLATNSDEDTPFEITEDEDTLNFLEREMTYNGITEKMVREKRRATHSLLKRDIMNVLKGGGDLDSSVTHDGASFLHVAVANFYNDLVKLVLKNRASDEVVDEEGWRPIHVAAYWGNEEAFKLLAKQRQTDIEVETNAGDTPYSLCDDADLKVYITGLLNKRKSHSNINLESNFYVFGYDSVDSNCLPESNEPKILFNKESHHAAKMSKLRRGSTDDIPTTLNPLFNPEASERASERKTSFREAKKYAPNIKSHSERLWETLYEEQDVLPDFKQENESFQNPRIITYRSDTESKEINQHLEHLIKNTTSTSENLNPVEELSRVQESEKESTSNPKKVTEIMDTTNDINNAECSDETNLNTVTDTTEVNQTNLPSDISSTKPVSSNNREYHSAVKKNALQTVVNQTSTESSLPKNTLFYVKKQRQQQSNMEMKKFSDSGTFPSGRSSTDRLSALPSPTMIRYRFTEPDIVLGHSIVRKKQCYIM